VSSPASERRHRRLVSNDPELAVPLSNHAAATLSLFTQQAAARASGNTAAPRFPQEQLVFALQSYCIAPETQLILHPRVQRRLDKLKAAIDGTRAGTSEECDQVCVKLATAIVAFG
jgi:hypothetical protein